MKQSMTLSEALSERVRLAQEATGLEIKWPALVDTHAYDLWAGGWDAAIDACQEAFVEAAKKAKAQ